MIIQTSNITIGCDLPALQFAHQNGTYFVFNKLLFPKEFEPSYIKNAWALLYTDLMFKGKIIGGDNVEALNIKDENIFVICRHNIINKINYDIVYVFDDENIVGLPPIKKETNCYEVIDYIKPIYLRVQNTNSIYTKDRLVSELHIIKKYSTSPVRLYSVSNLKKEELASFDYSDTMVRFKCENILAKYGHKGDRSAHIQLETAKRTIIKFMNVYEDTKKIKFMYGN